MEESLREEIKNAIVNVLQNIDIKYEILFEPSSINGKNDCFTIYIDIETAYDDYYVDIEKAIQSSGIISLYRLYMFWEDCNLCLCVQSDA